jgi:hypothetical protein
MMLLSGIVLPEGIRAKVEGFGAVVPVVRPSPKAEGFGSNSAGPQGFPLAGPRFVGRTWPYPDTTRAVLLADRLAIGETEPFPDNNIMV